MMRKARSVGAWSLAIVIAVVVGGCSTGVTPLDTPPSPGFFLGADLSALARVEQAGGVFRDGGQPRDAIAILHSYGANMVRLRLFVRPDDSDVQVNDLDYTVRLATRAKAAGADLLLDLHYSDTWADPGHQTMPSAWTGLGIDSLAGQVESYTANVVTRLKAAGALPRIVQVGNEVDGGMLWPVGQLYGTALDTLTQWEHFTRLLKAGIQGVQDALAPGDSVRIMLHYSNGGDAGGTRWFFDHLVAYGVAFDIIGVSYYPWWHGALAGLRSNLAEAAQRYGRDIMVVETSYPWRAGGWEGMVTDGAAMTWPTTPAGQSQFLGDVVAAVGAVPGGHGAGVIWWYPEAIAVPGLFVWGGGSLALFDAGGNVLPAATRFGTH